MVYIYSYVYFMTHPRTRQAGQEKGLFLVKDDRCESSLAIYSCMNY